ncbi:Ionotropic glutamate receptor L-glutamate and glycine-binding domain [Trinorchestia longiramus]|nr:Ionotropic glutamate receptor L-glutamate and glycine-binding domain [Trinorchestia longiramus]
MKFHDRTDGELGSKYQQLPLLLGKTCLVRYTAEGARQHETNRRDLPPSWSTPTKLIISLGTSRSQLLTLRQRDWTEPRLVLLSPALFHFALDALPWPLNNKALLLVLEDSGASAWDVYRVGASAPAVSRYLSTVSVPPLQGQIYTLRREPWFRRANLSRLLLRCMSGDYPPFSMTSPQPDGTIALSGLAGDVWQILQQHLHFELVCHAEKDGLWGSYDSARSEWNGILGQLRAQTVDVAAGPFAQNLQRGKFFDFSNALYSRRDDTRVQLQDIPPVPGHEWDIPPVLGHKWDIPPVLGHEWGIPPVPGHEWDVPPVPEHEWDIPPVPEHECPECGWRIWLLTELVTVVVLNVYYSCFLTAILSSDISELPIKSLQDIYERRNQYSLGLLKDSSMVETFKFASEDDVILKKIWKEMISIDPRSLTSTEENIERSLADPRHVSLTEYNYYRITFTDCRLTLLPGKEFSASVGFPFRQNLPVKQVINYWILKLTESGILRKLHIKWENKARKEELCAPSSPIVLGLEESYTAFLLLGAGLLLSVTILLGEWSHYYTLRRARKP